MKNSSQFSYRGSRVYSSSHRIESIVCDSNGIPTLASKSSINRWRKRPTHLAPSGNHPPTEIDGEYKELLKLFRLTYPKAHLHEAAFIYNHATIPILFSPSHISEKEKELGFTWKKASTDAVQLRDEEKKKRVFEFFNLPPPYGIAGVELDCLIDIDESPWTIGDCNRSYGKAISGQRVRDTGMYSRTDKWTLILAVGGDDQLKNFRFSKDKGTTINMFYHFLEQLISLLPKGKAYIFLFGII